MTDTDDAPLWAEVWGMWFALGICLRTWIHMWTAADFEDPGQLSWPDDDRKFRSPVTEIHGTQTELAATIISAVTGVMFWVLLPLTPPGPMHTPFEYAAGVWLTMQVIPLLGDPVALLIADSSCKLTHRDATNATKKQ